MSTPARKRLIRDLKALTANPPEGINAAPDQDNLMLWTAVIIGPVDTSVFLVLVRLPVAVTAAHYTQTI